MTRGVGMSGGMSGGGEYVHRGMGMSGGWVLSRVGGYPSPHPLRTWAVRILLECLLVNLFLTLLVENSKWLQKRVKQKNV